MLVASGAGRDSRAAGGGRTASVGGGSVAGVAAGARVGVTPGLRCGSTQAATSRVSAHSSREHASPAFSRRNDARWQQLPSPALLELEVPARARDTLAAMARRVGGAAAIVGVVAALVAGGAVARDVERRIDHACRTVEAFEQAPTLDALKKALALAGTRGRVRLDLSMKQASELEAPRPAVQTDGEPAPPPVAQARWEKPLEGARAIAAAKTMEGVKELVLGRYPMTAKAAGALGGSTHFGALESLVLTDTRVSADALHELLAPGAFPGAGRARISPTIN